MFSSGGAACPHWPFTWSLVPPSPGFVIDPPAEQIPPFVRPATIVFDDEIAPVGSDGEIEQRNQLSTPDQIVDERNPAQRHALPHQCGLQDQGVVVEGQVVAARRQRQSVEGEPVGPGQPVGGHDAFEVEQRQRQEIARRTGATTRQLEARAADGQYDFGKKTLGLASGPAAVAERDGDVHRFAPDVDFALGGDDADIQVRHDRAQSAQPRHQPPGGKAEIRRHVENAAPGAGSDGARRGMDGVERLPRGFEQPRPVGREDHATMQTPEKRRAEIRLQPRDLMADGRLGDAEFTRRGAEVQQPASRLEERQGLKGRQATAGSH